MCTNQMLYTIVKPLLPEDIARLREEGAVEVALDERYDSLDKYLSKSYGIMPYVTSEVTQNLEELIRASMVFIRIRKDNTLGVFVQKPLDDAPTLNELPNYLFSTNLSVFDTAPSESDEYDISITRTALGAAMDTLGVNVEVLPVVTFLPPSQLLFIIHTDPEQEGFAIGHDDARHELTEVGFEESAALFGDSGLAVVKVLKEISSRLKSDPA